MSTLKPSLTWLVVAVAALSGSFAVGRWSGALQQSLQSETTCPWELHRKIAQLDLQCEQLRSTQYAGQFYVQPIDNGATLIVAMLDVHEGKVRAFALDAVGRIASDTWALECK